MKSINNAKKYFSFSLIFLAAALLSAESFRVAKTAQVNIPQSYEAQTTNCGVFDGLAIYLPKDTTFISGIELNIKVPDTVAQWRDTIAYFLYDNVSPAPVEGKIDYSGNRLSVNTIPGKLNLTVYIPLTNKFNVKQSPYATIISGYSNKKADFVFLRFILAMKGAPESLEHAVFDISVKPVLTDEGYFDLAVKHPQGKNGTFEVYIDDNQFAPNQFPVILKSGEHHLSVTSKDYRNETRTFIVEQAKKTSQTVQLKGIEPLIKIISPENARILLDGADFAHSKDAVIITPGDHTVKFIIGDYEITKTVKAVNGRTYTVNLNVDATVSEDE